MIVRDVLRAKGSQVHTVAPNQPVRAAIDAMCQLRIGALAVVLDGRLVGMLSERDLLFLYRRGADLDATLVGDVMTRDVVIGLPDDSLDHVVHVMTERRFRHLPVLEHGRLVGMCSIGDVVKARRVETEFEVRALRAYISGAAL